MATAALELSEEPILATGVPALQEQEVEALLQDPCAPPLLDGKWKSLVFRRRVVMRLTACVCMIIVPLVGMLPLLRDIIYTVVCDSLGLDDEQCAVSDEVNEKVARFYAVQTFLFSLLMIIAVPLVTGISERFGYRAGLIWSALWFSADMACVYVLAYVVPKHWTHWRMLVLTLFEVTAGGAVTINNMTLLAVFQLFPEPELRPRYTSLVNGLIGLAASLAPFITPLIAQRHGLSSVPIASCAFLLCAAGYALVMGELPEFQYTSKAATNEGGVKKSLWATAHEYVRTQLSGLSVLSFRHVGRAVQRTAFVILFCRIVSNQLRQGGQDALAIFAKQHFGWDKQQFGTMTAVDLASMTFWGLLGFPLLQKSLVNYFEVNPLGFDRLDYCFMLWSSILLVSGYAGIATAQNGAELMTAWIVQSQVSIAGPTYTTAIMKLLPSSEGASFVTAAAIVDNACGVFVPALLLQIYHATLSWWPRLVFELETAICLAQLLAIVFFTRIVLAERVATP